jgi:hypothetical protein
VIRTYQAGMIGEKIKYWVPGEKPTKSDRKIKSDIKKQQQNEASVEKRVARFIHANFKPNDVFFGLDYSEYGLSVLVSQKQEADKAGNEIDWLRECANKQLRLYLRRARRECEKQGIEFKYIAITSDMDGDTGEAVRIHHHLIIPAEVMEICKAKWKLGGTNYEMLWKSPDQTTLAKYLMDQVRRLPEEKKYIPSRNLIQPEPKDRTAQNGSELRVPRNCILVHRSEFKPGRPQYIRYVITIGTNSGGGFNDERDGANNDDHGTAESISGSPPRSRNS